MNMVTLLRVDYSDQGTLGQLFTDGFKCYTLELPWRDNQRRISCIPEGFYICKPRFSQKFGRVYQVTDVENRDGILIHQGNYAGSPPWKTHVEGCILLGNRYGTLDGQRAVLISRPAVSAFMAFMNHEPFKLNIRSLI